MSGPGIDCLHSATISSDESDRGGVGAHKGVQKRKIFVVGGGEWMHIIIISLKEGGKEGGV